MMGNDFVGTKKINILENVSLKPYNTFGVEVIAKQFIEVKEEEDLPYLFEELDTSKPNYLVLGGGSNILFVTDYTGLVIHMNNQGIESEVKGNKVIVRSKAGVVWNDLVWYCINHGFSGVENLTLIPGTVGAAPVQNIGAYGTELKDVFISCKAFDIVTKSFVVLTKDMCQFGYRDSIFKNSGKDRYIIVEVTLELSLKANINATYGKIQEKLDEKGISLPTIADIANVVMEIRNSRIPNPKEIGNTGSFFQNPMITVNHFAQLKIEYPNIPYFEVDERFVKIPAGWLIEQCGWKGKQVGSAGVWKNHGLILVNHGGATGKEIFELSTSIIQDVKQKFNIELEREVNII